MNLNVFSALIEQLRRFLSCFVYPFVLAALSVLITACVSGGGGGSSSTRVVVPGERIGLFSHASYAFVMLNTTQTNAPEANRTLGLIDLEDAEVRARLPEGAVWHPSDVRYTIVGGANDLTRAFFTLGHGNSATLIFQADRRYASRTFTLDYVVNTLGVDALRVEANISYVDSDGNNQTLGLFTVPVTIRAVAEVPSANAFLAFDGIRQSGAERRAMPRSSTSEESFDAGRLRETINITTVGPVVRAFTARWTDANYVADADEPTPAAAFDRAQLLANNQVAKRLNVDVTLILDNDSAQQVDGTYQIAADTNIGTINGNSSVDGSFLTFLKNLNTTGTRSEGLSDSDFVAVDDNDNVGPNVTEVAWSFTFAYTAEVTTTTTSTENVRVSSVAYTAEGTIDENVAGRTRLRGPAEVLRALGIDIKRPAGFEGPLPTLYFQVANANASDTHCATAFYLDQGYRDYRHYQIKAQASPEADDSLLDHETEDRYACQLEASLRGTNTTYRAITTGNLTDTNNQTTAVSGTAVGLNVAHCGAANATTRLQALRTAPGCIYRAGLDIAVNDVNEPVMLEFRNGVVSAARNETNIGFATGTDERVVGTPLDTSDAAALELATFTYVEEDEDANETALDVDVPIIQTVAPAQIMLGGTPMATNDLFYIERDPTANNTARLLLNATVAADVLDYEALTATGQPGYRVTIAAPDSAMGFSQPSLIATETFTLEVTDVVYTPAELRYRPAPGLNFMLGDPPTQHLLPGFAQFVANGGPVLGQLATVDPESNTNARIAYEYLGAEGSSAGPADDLRLGSNFNLSRAPARVGIEDDELVLVGLGLRAGDAFTVRLRAVHTAAPMLAFRDYEVRTVVSDTGAPALTFDVSELVGFVAEGQAGALVRNVSQLPLKLSDGVSGSDAALMPHFEIVSDLDSLFGLAMLRADVEAKLFARLGRSIDVAAFDGAAEAFVLASSGANVSLVSAADFTQQSVYTLLARVVNASDVDAPNELLKSDYAVVQVVVEDTNTAPRIVDLTAVGDAARVEDTQDRVLFTVPEDVASGAVLATLQVEDDNPLTEVNFAPAAGATAYAIERTQDSQRVAATAAKPAHYVASYRLVTVAPDYEANKTLDIAHQLHDNGQYAYDPLRQRVVPDDPDAINSTTLRVNGSIEDVNEAPALRFAADAVDVMEDAAEGAPVVMVTAMDPDGGAANLTYTLTTNPASLASAFNVGNVSATPTNDDGREATWMLRVADTEALENAGDGQIFTLTLTATDPGDESVSARLDITVVDVQRFDASAVNITLVTLSEQEALDDPDRVLRAPLFRFADVQPDYDEYFFGLGPSTPNPVRFGEVNFEAAPSAMSRRI